ncbi:MAG TPA: hypothetical protein VLH38_03430 [Patescibacteria group bacterium]|nr:hypothetical protein [Patescibacteria group bacterium]
MSVLIESDSRVGIIGAGGELGRWMTIQAASHGADVAVCDTRELVPTDFLDVTSRLDRISTLTDMRAITIYPDLQEVVKASEIIHWCAPLEALGELALAAVGETKLIMLHSSVMAKSTEAMQQIHERGLGAAIIHCLVNEERTVVIGDGSDHDERVTTHFKDIGLRPVSMSTSEHDQLMARTQAPLALLLPLLPELQARKEQGLLTPSASVLLSTLAEVKGRWTPLTVRTLLENPHLPTLMDVLGIRPN